MALISGLGCVTRVPVDHTPVLEAGRFGVPHGSGTRDTGGAGRWFMMGFPDRRVSDSRFQPRTAGYTAAGRARGRAKEGRRQFPT